MPQKILRRKFLHLRTVFLTANPPNVVYFILSLAHLHYPSIKNEGERQALSSLAYDEISSGDVSVLIPSTERVEQQTAKGHLK